MGPLCKILGKEVPKEPFRKANEKADLKVRIKAFVVEEGRMVGNKLGSALAILAVMWLLKRQFLV